MPDKPFDTERNYVHGKHVGRLLGLREAHAQERERWTRMQAAVTAEITWDGSIDSEVRAMRRWRDNVLAAWYMTPGPGAD